MSVASPSDVIVEHEVVTESSSLSPPESIKLKERTPYLQKPNILFVRDSVSEAANLRILETLTNARIRPARKVVFNDLEQTVKQNLNNSGREEFEYLVLSAPSNVITEMRSSEESSLNENVFKSCKQVIKVAEEALTMKSSLKGVIIMNHSPRFDSQKMSKLAKMANSILNSELNKSSLKHKISVGVHSLEDFGIGKTHNRRYLNNITGHYDGLHFFGPSGSLEYTKSLAKAMQNNLVNHSTKINKSSTANSQVSSSLLSHNRFSVLGEGNY